MLFDYSLHDAWVESVTVGPRREINLALALGPARITDPRLPDAATFRLGSIENFEQAREFFARFETDPIARIDRMKVLKRAGASFVVAIEIDPQGTVEVICSKIELIPTVRCKEAT